jgi:ribonuclease J
LRARIHRGAHEIGGNCVELEADGKRLVLDVGRPLWAGSDEDVPLPSIAGLRDGNDPSLVGVLLSHAHPDHYGLMDQVDPSVPLFTGEATARILKEAAFFTPSGLDRRWAGYMADREPLRLGPFTVTPYLVDHSAFDAYALLVEAEGRSLFYSGDLRGHGRKAALFERLVDNPPADVDVLLIEGTRLGRPATDGDLSSETEVEERCVELFRETTGLVLAAFSMQNVDRVVTLYRAATRSGRELALDLYGAEVMRATGRATIPQPGFERLRFFVPQSQRVKVLRTRQFERMQPIRRDRIYPEELADHAGELVLSFRPSMAAELDRARCLEGAAAVWSMWSGYLREERLLALHEFLERHGIPLTKIHASGHATVEDLVRLARAIRPSRIVPIHTAHHERFAASFGAAEVHRDLEWWTV